MDIQRFPKNNDWLSESVFSYYVQYVNAQMIYKEDFITQLLSVINEHQEEEIMEYCSGISGLLYQSIYPDTGSYITYAETNLLMLNAIKKQYKQSYKNLKLKTILCDNDVTQIKDETYSIIYAFDFLHNCNDIKKQIDILLKKIKTGGQLWFYDLRRDAEDAMLKQIMLGYKRQRGEEASWYLSNFISSWRASYTVDEVKNILSEQQFISYEVNKANALTLSVKIKKFDRE